MELKSFLLTLSILLAGTVALFGEGAGIGKKPVDAVINEAWGVFEELDQSGNFVNALDEVIKERNLPVGIVRNINNNTYSVAVSNVRLFDSYAELTVWGRLVIPENSEKGKRGCRLFFGSQAIKLSYEGDIIGDSYLTLLGDVPLEFCGGTVRMTLKGGFNPAVGVGDLQTYMGIDCGGFKKLKITADVVFEKELIRKAPSGGSQVQGDSLVTTSFSVEVEDWSDVLVDITLPAFKIIGLDGFIFSVGRAVLDFSDKRNAPSVNFPQDYEQEYMIPGNPQLWRGVYISELKVALPEYFRIRGDSKKRVEFQAQDMLFDNNGISALLSVRNLISLEDGSAGGWPFSIDEFKMDVVANQLIGAGFGGEIRLPVSSQRALRYEALISPGNEYLMKVTTLENIDFDIWAAQVSLLPNSYVKLEIKDGDFLPEAMLSGVMDVNSGVNAAVGANIKGIEFRRLNLKTKAPCFMVDYFGWKGNAQLGSFPVTIGKIALTTTTNEASLGFDLNVKMGESPFDIAAGTRLDIVGSMVRDRGFQTWKYKRLELSKILLDASVAEVFSLKGELMWMQDDIEYGNGFAGQIALKLRKGLELEVKSQIIFGYKDFRYWLVDGNVSFGRGGVPVVGPLKISGFGGGAYYRIAHRVSGRSDLPTGIGYVPSKEVGLGIKAAVMLNLGQPEMINGEASFEIAFNRRGGLAFIGLFGRVQFMTPPEGMDNITKNITGKFTGIVAKSGEVTDKQALEKDMCENPSEAAKDVFPGAGELRNAALAAAMGVQYDFNQRSFHATFDVYANFLGGMLKGTGPGNCVGHSVLHIEPGEWYVHMGSPSIPLGLELNLLGLIRAKTEAYFMTGSRIPGSPPPPQQVADILGMELSKLDYMRDMNALGDGRGIAFGTHLSVSTGDITFLILYANLQAGLGFDIMMKDYGDAQCKGHNGPVGINGWYANGQAYAYLQGEVGVKVNLFFIKKKIPVIKAGAAILMQAKLPNPAWFAGYLGVKFDLLGGLVKGNIRMKLKLGKECELVIPGGSPLGVKMISDIQPSDKADGVDVFAIPQVAFNMPVGQKFEMEEDGGLKIYQLKLEEYSLSVDGVPLNGRIEWNPERDAASFYSHEILPPHAQVKAAVRISFEEFRNGTWNVVYTGGRKALETKDVTFTTGGAPDVIPMSNVAYAYPVVDQRFYLPGESTSAYIQLKRGQSYLFSDEFRHEIHLTSQAGDDLQILTFRYNTAENKIEYVMPGVNPESAYTFDLLSYSKGQGNLGGVAVQEREEVGDGENEVSLRAAKAGQIVRVDAGKSLISYAFAVSRYSTLAEKITRMVKVNPSAWKYWKGEVFLEYILAGSEPFDRSELIATPYNGGNPLVVAAALLDDNYYKEEIYPLLYRNYPLGDIFLSRTGDQIGVPPVGGVMVMAEYLTYLDSGNEMATGRFPYIYNLPSVYKRDFLDLRWQLANRYLDTPRLAEYGYLVNTLYPAFPEGIYRAVLKYHMPDGRWGSSATFDYKY